MLIYRFKVTCEEHDGFLREIEIQPGQTFLDFHHIMVDSAELLHCQRASFFMTDKRYKKDREISLKAEKRQVRKYDEDLDQVVADSVTLPLMKVSKLKDFIEDPHQKMIYEFEGRDHFAFHIELYKICPADNTESFPRCLRRTGELPKKAEQPAVTAPAPAPPKVVIPKIPLPKIEALAKLDDMVEDEHELAAIESELEGLLADDHTPAFEGHEEPETSAGDEITFEGHDEELSDRDEQMDHLEDYEDIENLDKRLSGFDRDSDDF